MKRILTALALVLLLATSAFAGKGDLFLYIWSEYIPDQVLQDFTKETGIEVHLSTYDSNEAMYAKIKLAGDGYDLIVPSSDYVALMAQQNLLLPLDKSLLPNFANLAPRFLNQPFDKGNTYSLPYMWGSTSIAVNTDLLGDVKVESIADLWNPALKDKLLLPNDPREVFGLALRTLGYPGNETDPEHLAQAYDKLKSLIPMVRVFDSDSPKQAMLSGEVAVGVIWSGEAFVACAENPAIKWIYPPEGVSLWMDSLCIPKGAKNIKEAHAFLDYLMRPEVAALISQEMGYSTPNAKAMAVLPADVRDNPIVYPPDDVMQRGEFQNYLGDAMKIYDDYWIKLKTHE